MHEFDPNQYGREFALLLQTNRCRPLGPGKPVDSMRRPLKAMTVEAAFAGAAHVDPPMAACCLAALWMAYDFLDEAHQICQDVETTSGSFWHAIMHRREGDFSNAKYWFRRVDKHPVFDGLAARTAKIAEQDPQLDAIDSLADRGVWDPFAFVDLCQQVAAGTPNIRQECELIQQAEWELLFDYCYRHATWE